MRQQVVQRCQVDLGDHPQRLDESTRGRREDQLTVRKPEEERFLAERIAGEMNLLPVDVDKRKGIHPAETPEQPVESPLAVAVDEHFRVAMRREVKSRPLKLRSEFSEVAYLPVEDHVDRCIHAPHGLMPRCRQIDDGVTSLPQDGPRARGESGSIRSADCHDFAHSPHPFGVDGLTVWAKYSSDRAHQGCEAAVGKSLAAALFMVPASVAT